MKNELKMKKVNIGIKTLLIAVYEDGEILEIHDRMDSQGGEREIGFSADH